MARYGSAPKDPVNLSIFCENRLNPLECARFSASKDTVVFVKIKNRGIAALFVAAALGMASILGIPAAQAATTSISVPADGAAVGLNLHYRAGVSAQILRFNVSAQLGNLGLNISSDRPLGSGWHSLRFTSPVTSGQALAALQLAQKNPEVLSGGVDTFTRSPAATSKPGPSANNTTQAAQGSKTSPQLLPTSTFKGATAPASLVASDGFDASAPSAPTILVKWNRPATLGSGVLSGYRVQTSTDGGKTFQNISPDLGSTSTSVRISDGIVAGNKISVRVAALTKYKGLVKVGSFTASKVAAATTAPVAPTLSSLALASTTRNPTWNSYSLADAGGLPVTFTVIASAVGHPDVVCKTMTYSCDFVGLVVGVNYTIKVTATNARGTSKSVSGFEVNDPMFKQQWALNSKYGINVESAWQHTHGSSSTTVAVLDSGISAHPDLDTQVWRNLDGSVYGYDFVTKTSDPTGTGCVANPTDPNSANEWHGTHVSGIIAAAANDQGVIGVAPGVKLLEVKVMGASGGSSSDLIAGLNWAAGRDIPTSVACGSVPKNVHPASVINLSLGNANGSCDTGTASVLAAIKDLGITVVTAAGNDSYQAAISYPGNCFPTINVAATSYDGTLASYTNFGVGVDIAAPGGDTVAPADLPAGDDSGIISTVNLAGTKSPAGAAPVAASTPGYWAYEGTSMAAPMVAGVVALLYSIKPKITFDQVWEALKTSATPFPSAKSVLNFGNISVDCSTAVSNSRTGCGVGIVNAGGAIDYALKTF